MEDRQFIEEAELITSSPMPIKTQEVIELTFFDAVREMIEGKRVTKKEWGDNNTYCLMANEHLSIHINNKINDWIVSQADIQGIDWIVLE